MNFRLDLPSTLQDARTYRRLSLYQFVYSLSGLVLGLACLVGGVLLFLHGVAGTTSWTARALGAETQMSDAAPGAILFVIGLFVVVVTRFSVRLQPPARTDGSGVGTSPAPGVDIGADQTSGPALSSNMNNSLR